MVAQLWISLNETSVNRHFMYVNYMSISLLLKKKYLVLSLTSWVTSDNGSKSK